MNMIEIISENKWIKDFRILKLTLSKSNNEFVVNYNAPNSCAEWKYDNLIDAQNKYIEEISKSFSKGEF